MRWISTRPLPWSMPTSSAQASCGKAASARPPSAAEWSGVSTSIAGSALDLPGHAAERLQAVGVERIEQLGAAGQQIGRAHVCTPVTNAHLVCRLLLDKTKT